jgi:hypothetical protein
MYGRARSSPTSARSSASERPHVANVVVARLLAEAAHAHVLDHARPQRADGPVGRLGDLRCSGSDAPAVTPYCLLRSKPADRNARSPPARRVRSRVAHGRCVPMQRMTASGEAALGPAQLENVVTDRVPAGTSMAAYFNISSQLHRSTGGSSQARLSRPPLEADRK